MKSACVYVVSVCLVAQATSSAIPMWEFLSRPEKASQLYYIYKTIVNDFCQTSSSPDCSKNYMVTGIQTIANMNEHDLDKLDPNQHGAKDLIWRKLSGNAAASRVAHEPDNSFTGNNAVYSGNSDVSNSKEFYNIDLDNIGSHLTGPLVVRVLPDGRPIPGEEHTFVPSDDDLESIKLEKLPFFNTNEQKQYKRPYLRNSIYNKKPVKYTKNYASGNGLDYRNHARIQNEKGLYYGLNEIPRYRRFYMTFGYKF